MQKSEYSRRYRSQIRALQNPVSIDNNKSGSYNFALSKAKVRQTYILYSSELNKSTHFTLSEIDTLMRIYFEVRDLFQPNMSNETLHNFFISIFKIYSENALKSLTFGFATESKDCITVKEFVRGLSLLLRGTLTEKCGFAFRIYKAFKKECLPGERQAWHKLREKATQIVSKMEADKEEAVTQILKMKTRKVLGGSMQQVEFMDTVQEYPFLLDCWFDFWPEKSYVEIFQRLFLRSTQNFAGHSIRHD